MVKQCLPVQNVWHSTEQHVTTAFIDK